MFIGQPNATIDARLALTRATVLPPSTRTVSGGVVGGATSPTRGFPSPSKAIFADLAKTISGSVAPTSQSNPFTGAAGSANNAGNIAGAGSGTGNYPTSPVAPGVLSAFQAGNSSADLALRIGLPVGAVLLFNGGHSALGFVAAGGAALLWANRLAGLNL